MGPARPHPGGRPGAASLACALLLGASSAGAEIDPATGLAVDPRLPLVRGQCTVCHSAALITQTRATRATWEAMIRWMQATQNLWPLPPPVENDILDYLSEHYAPAERRARRAPLDPSLLPP